MSSRRLPGSFWPSHRQQLLLVSALAEQREALETWQALRPQLDLQNLDDASFVTLPLIYRMLEAAGVDDPELPRLKGIYRSTWVKNNLLAERLGTAVEVFEASRVPVLLVGSIGAALRYYPAVGFRPTPYIELLVHEDERVRAVRALDDSGWSTRGPVRASRSEPVILDDREGGSCLLRTALAPDFVLGGSEDAHAPLWKAATRLSARDRPVLALGPTDDLLAAIVTGVRAAPAPSIQWIVDAAMMLRAIPEQIDWERLLSVGIERAQGLRLRDALEYLRRLGLLGPAAPEEIMPRLNLRKPTPRERLTHACTARAVRGLGSFPQALGQHLAETTGSSVAATITGLLGFLRRRWQVEHSWQLPLAGGQRAYRLLVRTHR